VSHNDWLLAVTSFVFAFGGWLIETVTVCWQTCRERPLFRPFRA
jgi:hypothetical protein